LTVKDNSDQTRMTHISDDRFREVVLSTLVESDGVQTVLSAEESRHFRNCAQCIDRLGDVARKIFERSEQPLSS